MTTKRNVTYQINSINAPTEFILGEEVDISWETFRLENGLVTTDTFYQTNAYISSDEILDVREDFALSFTQGSGSTNTFGGVRRYNVFPPKFIGVGDKYLIITAGDVVTSQPISILSPDVDVDLEITNTTSPNEGIIGEYIDLSLRVTNQGNEVANGSLYTYFRGIYRYENIVYISNDPILDSSDMELGSLSTVFPLEPGSSYTDENRSLFLPSNLESGEKYLIFDLDKNNNVIETNENNNTLAVPITLIKPNIDLVVTSANIASSSILLKDTIELSWTVANQGTETARGQLRPGLDIIEDIQDRIYYSQDIVLDESDIPLENYTVTNNFPLEGGDSYDENANIYFPKNLPMGNGYIIISTDDLSYDFSSYSGDDRQAESNENNNTFSIPISLSKPDVDLVLSSVTADDRADIGDTIYVSWTVTNQGSDSAKTTRTASNYDRVYLSQDNIFSEEDTILEYYGTDDFYPIRSSDSYSVNTSVELPDSITGNQYLIVVADSDNEQLETNKENNIQAIPITINSFNLILGTPNPDTIDGTSDRDKIQGKFSDDFLMGLANDDTLTGHSGRDTLIGGNGNDTLYGGLGDDFLKGSNGDDKLFGNRGNDRLSGLKGNDLLNGGGANDTLNGGQNQDTLRGGMGNDYLVGGSGVDFLIGNNGNDTFVIQNFNDSNGDVIRDFVDGVDNLSLSSGLTFSDLTIVNNEDNTATLIKDISNKVLVAINGVDSSLINSDDFV